MESIVHPKKYNVMHWHMQGGNITTNLKFEVKFTIPELSATNGVKW